MALFNKESSAREAEPLQPARPAENGYGAVTQPISPRAEIGGAPAKPADAAPAQTFSAFASRKPASEARAHLDQGCKISGKLEFEETARIDGQIDGEVIARDGLVIGESAIVTAQITASSIIVAGTVSGEITASERIEIHASAKVSGNVTTPRLIVHEGAIFEGHCSMNAQGAKGERKQLEPAREKRALAPMQDHRQAS